MCSLAPCPFFSRIEPASAVPDVARKRVAMRRRGFSQRRSARKSKNAPSGTSINALSGALRSPNARGFFVSMAFAMATATLPPLPPAWSPSRFHYGIDRRLGSAFGTTRGLFRTSLARKPIPRGTPRTGPRPAAR